MSYDSFYRYFDVESNNGLVFASDLNAMENLPYSHLTGAEVEERDAWRNKITGIQIHYRNKALQVKTVEELLQQRLMIPNLGSHGVSTRSKATEARKCRRYPASLNVWNGFNALVANYKPSDEPLNEETMSNIFAYSCSRVDRRQAFGDEKAEQNYLTDVLHKSLVLSGLVGGFTERGGMGKPDSLTLKTEAESGLATEDNMGIVVEFKSTHNLPLPMSAVAVVNAYNEAYRLVIQEKQGRTTAWSRVCHPIGQLLNYMVENGRRFGVLSSGTRAYFLQIQGHGGDAVVSISDAFLVGEQNFLRAWAFAHSLGCAQADKLASKSLGWKSSSAEHPTPSAKSTYQGDLRNKTIEEGGEDDVDMEPTDKPSANTASSGLEEVPFEDIEILGVLGYGHNGVVHVAKWQGKEVALKQFDIGKDGYGYYNNEIKGYMAVEDAWGKLVTKPLFVSESWSGSIKFIGLQLGRNPAPRDDISGWSSVLTSLEGQFGFRHEDADDGNMVFVVDEVTGRERLVAIDLEAHTMVAGVH